MNNSEILGEEAAVRQLVEDDFSATNGVFEDDSVINAPHTNPWITRKTGLKKLILPNVLASESQGFITNNFGLIDLRLPGYTGVAWSQNFQGNFMLSLIDLGKCRNIYGSPLNGLSRLLSLVLRRSDNPTDFGGGMDGTPIVKGEDGAHVFVPRDLIESYQTATNWSALYATNPNVFQPLEDYTIDGTINGDIDMTKIWTSHTPVYSASNLLFDGTESSVVDTGVPLYDTDGKYTIIAKIIRPTKTTIYAPIFSCVIDDSNYLQLNHDLSSINVYSFRLLNTSSSVANINSSFTVVVIASGLSLFRAILNDENRILENGWCKSNTLSSLPQSNATLKLGVGNVAGRYWNGTIDKIKVYKDVLDTLEVNEILKTL